MVHHLKQLLQTALNKRDIDPTPAQLAMAPSDLTLKPPPADARLSAVMLLFYPIGNVLHLVFAKRPDYLKNHPGQIAFPGGRHEDGETFVETALRETEEELGLPGQQVEILGKLRPVYVPPSNFFVHPFVGWHPRQPQFKPDTNEVALVLEIPLRHFMDQNNQAVEERVFDNQTWPIPYYQFEEHKVWGATATILSEVVARMNGIVNN